METEKLSISLPKDMAQMIRQAVMGGRYASNSEVIREAVRDWQDKERERSDRLRNISDRINAAAESPTRISDDEMGRHFDDRLAGKRSP
ncbi:type II toxin-antitoxin system ParD family antitoxin [Labrys monachus]|uniref:Antitoxin ParD1/3/4 n=1 Tax=Labrys monachus TaxID=217067 RepID=A0ABU0FEG1_9HYPH|nr:type II toxin-antitoxin system ParD family antitoxin [Labrys monachus]MDQ0392508.1 antitoxin ParD1/3/4 [Labrys monachus]